MGGVGATPGGGGVITGPDGGVIPGLVPGPGPAPKEPSPQLAASRGATTRTAAQDRRRTPGRVSTRGWEEGLGNCNMGSPFGWDGIDGEYPGGLWTTTCTHLISGLSSISRFAFFRELLCPKGGRNGVFPGLFTSETQENGGFCCRVRVRGNQRSAGPGACEGLTLISVAAHERSNVWFLSCL